MELSYRSALTSNKMGSWLAVIVRHLPIVSIFGSSVWVAKCAEICAETQAQGKGKGDVKIELIGVVGTCPLYCDIMTWKNMTVAGIELEQTRMF